MQDLIKRIQKNSNEVPDVKLNVAAEIFSIDLSSQSVEEMRRYFQILYTFSKTTSNPDIRNCCTALMFKLATEEQSRPFKEQFPDLNMKMEKTRLCLLKPLI